MRARRGGGTPGRLLSGSHRHSLRARANPASKRKEAFASWTRSPQAALDTEVKRSGKQSARITIPEEQEDLTGVHLTQQVPVRAGQLYTAEAWVKTRGVAPKELGGKALYGRHNHPEWADKEGRVARRRDYALGSMAIPIGSG